MTNYSWDSAPWHTLRFTIVIESGVTYIGSYAFDNYCDGLTSVTVQWAEPLNNINENAFSRYETNTIKLIVPNGLETEYSTANVWKDFYIEGISQPFAGSCGENLTWTYDVANATLTISGTGDMTNYASGSVPWNNLCSKIRTVFLPDGWGVKNIKIL